MNSVSNRLLPLGILAIAGVALAFIVNEVRAERFERQRAPLEHLDDSAFLREHYPSADAVGDGLSLERPREEVVALLTVLPRAADAIEFLDRLAPLAASRDPDIAPAAARAAVEIVEACDVSSLELMELQIPEEARQAWQGVLDSEPRADIRAAAEYVMARLATMEPGENDEVEHTGAEATE